MHASCFHSALRIHGGDVLVLYCIPRSVKRRYVLLSRRLYIMPWCQGIFLLASPKTRYGNASLLMVMKGIFDRAGPLNSASACCARTRVSEKTTQGLRVLKTGLVSATLRRRGRRRPPGECPALRSHHMSASGARSKNNTQTTGSEPARTICQLSPKITHRLLAQSSARHSTDA